MNVTGLLRVNVETDEVPVLATGAISIYVLVFLPLIALGVVIKFWALAVFFL